MLMMNCLVEGCWDDNILINFELSYNKLMRTEQLWLLMIQSHLNHHVEKLIYDKLINVFDIFLASIFIRYSYAYKCWIGHQYNFISGNKNTIARYYRFSQLKFVKLSRKGEYLSQLQKICYFNSIDFIALSLLL